MKTNEVKNGVEIKNEVMDARLVRLNEIKDIKVSKLTKTARPNASHAKLAARFVIENWDNYDVLLGVATCEETKERAIEVSIIAQNRLTELRACAKMEAMFREAPEYIPNTGVEDTGWEVEATEEAPEEVEVAPEPTKRGRRVARKVGDLHTNGK